MPKRIVILFDGTSNEVKEDRTNILRLYGALKKSPDQLVYYDPGVGTLGGQRSFLRFMRKASELWGQITGWGLDDNVKDAYRFLVKNYNNGKASNEERDSIYIFGFSRGAYSARVLAAFIRSIGIIEERNINLLDYAYRAFKRIGEDVSESDNSFAEIGLYERMLDPDRPSIKFLGLFDTVSSVIESGRYGIRLRSHAFTNNNDSVEIVRHAIATHERRSMFRHKHWGKDAIFKKNPFLKQKTKTQDVREVWFFGTHGDVGGGAPESESRLAKIPLDWMINQAKLFGLKFNTATVDKIVLGKDKKSKYVPPHLMGKLHDRVNLLWRSMEIIPRRKFSGSKRHHIFGWTLPLLDWRHIPNGSYIHHTVLKRIKKNNLKLKNMPKNYKTEP
ncbi:MAG: DUF2235 domain-containing protein [Hellea sp.]|nr:DUF2235 domain-containing protein [Hellea sp.]